MIRIFLTVVLLAAVACETPRAPSVVADFTVPLANKTYTVFDIKDELENGKDSIRLEIVSDSVLFTVVQEEIITIGDHLDADPTVDSAEGLIENDLTLNDSIQASFSIGSIAPSGVTDLHGTTAVIPPFSIPETTHEVTFNRFTRMAIESGYLRTVVTNQTSILFDSLRVILYDPGSAAVVDSAIISDLSPSGGVDVHFKNFVTGRVVRSPLEVIVSGYTSGSGTPVLIDSTESISVDLRFDITASSLTGFFASQQIFRKDSLKTTSNSVIDTGYIESGKITVDFVLNGLQIGADVNFASNDFDSAGFPLRRNLRLPAAGPIQIKLNGWKLVPKGGTIGDQYIRYSYDIVTDSSSNSATTISGDQGVKAYATVDTLRFSRLVARLAEEQIDIDKTSRKLDFKGIDSIQLDRAYFEITTEHRIPFPVTFDLTATGRRGGLQKSVAVHASIDPYTGGPGPKRDTIRTNNHAELAELLSLLPDSVYFEGTALLGDNLTKGAVNKSDSIITRIFLRTPLVFKLPVDSTRNIVQPKPTEIDISDGDKRRINERLRRVIVTGKIINHFPVPVTVQFLVDSLPDKASFYNNSSSSFRFAFPTTPLFIDKGTTDANGVVISPKEVNLDYTLLPDDYQRLFNPDISAIYRGLRVQILGTGEFLKISSMDFIDIDADMQFQLFIDEDIGR